MTHRIIKDAKLVLAFGAVAAALLIIVPSAEAATCSITKDLQLGTMDEEVRCLQQYLNSHGHPIATTGVGSAGKETTEFKSLTQAAVVKWQMANGVSPATGYFGPKSRAKLAELIAGGGTPPGLIWPHNAKPPAPTMGIRRLLRLLVCVN